MCWRLYAVALLGDLVVWQNSFERSRGATKHLAALAWQSALQLVEVMAKQGQGAPVAYVGEGLQEDIGSVFCHTDLHCPVCFMPIYLPPPCKTMITVQSYAIILKIIRSPHR